MTKAWMVSVSALALAWTTPGWAQAQSSDGSLLDELIVTAQKREESVQDVPIAVSAFSEQSLKAQGIDTGGGSWCSRCPISASRAGRCGPTSRSGASARS